MTLIKCNDCGKETSSSAKSCPNCGSPVKNNNFVGGLLLGVLFFVFIGPCINFLTGMYKTSADSVDSSVEQLELLSSRGYHKTSSYMEVEGQVKNISDVKLDNVDVLVQWYDKKDNLITSDSTLIEFNPILPGQVSPYHSISTYSPEMEKYSVSFKTLWGKTIRFKDSRH